MEEPKSNFSLQHQIIEESNLLNTLMHIGIVFVLFQLYLRPDKSKVLNFQNKGKMYVTIVVPSYKLFLLLYR